MAGRGPARLHFASKSMVRFGLVSVKGIRSVSEHGFAFWFLGFFLHANVQFFQRYGVAFPPQMLACCPSCHQAALS